MARILILTIVLMALVSVGLSQKRTISREEFSKQYSSVVERSKEFSRTHDSKKVASMGGVVKTLTWKWIYTEKFNSHLKFEETSDKGAIIFEMINIAENTFCKLGDGEWTKTQGGCDFRVPWMITQMSYMMESGANSEFFAESLANSGKDNTRYTELGQVPMRKTPSGSDIPPMTYESVFVTDAKGRLVRQEYTRYATGTKKDSPSWVDSLNYDQKDLKIETPLVK